LESDGESDNAFGLRERSGNAIRSRKGRRDQFGRKRSDEREEKEEKDQTGMGMGDLLMGSDGREDLTQVEQVERVDDGDRTQEGYFSPRKEHGPPEMASLSPVDVSGFTTIDEDRYLQKRRESLKSRKVSMYPDEADRSGFSGGLSEALDGGSGVGFFELDEELASPSTGEAKPFEFQETEDVGLHDPNTADEPSQAGQGKRVGAGSFAAGSVPINIVRPSMHSITGSWVGTFGH